MIWINKRKPSPELNKAVREAKKTANWKQIVQDNNVSLARKTFDGLHKDIIQSSLYAEQHGLCAYCMRKLHDPDDVIIEHIQPLSTHIDQALNYRNWAGVCDGGQKSPDSRKILCCDASKHNQEIHINVYDKEQMSKIRYHRDGTIYTYPRDEAMELDINQVLCLNGKCTPEGRRIDTSTHLVGGRKKAYVQCQSFFRELKKRNKYRSGVIFKRIDQLLAQEEYDEFLGATIYFLRHEAQRLQYKEQQSRKR